MRLNIKPLSVNQAWQGRRYKTDAYKRYERDVLMMLKPLEIPEGNLSLSMHFGFSSSQADIDNPVKPFMDVLQKKYGFNDSRVFHLSLTKEKVEKGCEFIKFEIKEA